MQADALSAETASLVDLLLTVAYIDGRFHQREEAFVQRYIDSLVLMVEQTATDLAERARKRGESRSHFEQIYPKLHDEVRTLSDEVQAANGDNFVASRLKLRALTLFRTLAPARRPAALELIQAMIRADGMTTPSEHELYQELKVLFEAEPPPAPAAPAKSAAATPTLKMPAQAAPAPAAAAPAPVRRAGVGPMKIAAAQWNPLKSLAHPLLDPLEETYSPHPVELQAQVARDYELVTHAIATWERLRAHGNRRLTGVTDLASLPVGSRFLDGHVHVMRPEKPVELVVFGDLHGCYGCLKAGLLQSDFINRAWAHQWDPANHHDVKLVLLGDYIDRGLFSFDGVLRTVLQLLVSMPDQVVVLRGNHEWFISNDYGVMSGVHPAEALSSLRPHVPRELLEGYRVLFENMPTSFLCDGTLFVHGGIPREDTFAASYRDLASLNDPELRFQMMWSDPTDADHVPVELQRQDPRFTFGRNQFRAFMERAGFDTLIRGHDKIERGFETVFDLGDRALLNLFSAGGHDSCDLPPDSSYRKVTPMALTIDHGPGKTPVAVPWQLDYQPFNHAPHNGLHRPLPLLEFRYG